jgi:uncharacterized protein
MQRSAKTLIVVLLFAAFCSAQDASSDRSQSVAAAAKASQAQVKIDQMKEADIRRLLELTHAGQLATQTMTAMEANMRPLMTDAFPQGEYRKKLISLFFDKFHSKLDVQELVDMGVPAYKKYYSDDEIKQLIAFYQTPLGQKMLDVTPKLVGELQAAGQNWGQQLGRQCMQEVLAEHPELADALEHATKTAQAAQK